MGSGTQYGVLGGFHRITVGLKNRRFFRLLCSIRWLSSERSFWCLELSVSGPEDCGMGAAYDESFRKGGVL